MIGRGWVSWIVGGVVASLLVTSCGKDSKNPGTAPITSDGGGEAGTGASSGGDANGNTTPEGGAAGGGPVADTKLGLHCEADADCSPGLRCLGADQDYPGGTGAPPGGICTADCETNADCRGFDATAVCATLDEVPIMLNAAEEPAQRLCMQGCSFGAPSGETKCHGQLDMACRPFALAPVVSCLKGEACPDGSFCFRGACREAACGPRCNSDADCVEGRSCNAATGLCDEGTQAAVPIGAECPGDQDPTSTVCGNGTCLLLMADGLSVKRMCTQTCTIGSLCGDEGACALPRLDPFAAGDIGYCMERCDCDADCSHPDDKCFPWASTALAAHFQSRGICDTFVDGDKTLSACDGSGMGGAGGSGGASNEAGGAGGQSAGGQGGAG